MDAPEWKLPFCDVGREYRHFQEDIERKTTEILRSGRYILGPEVLALENELAKNAGANFCVGVSSGTDALVLALLAFNVGRGDELPLKHCGPNQYTVSRMQACAIRSLKVIVPSFTWVSTAEAVLLVGATPVFVDISLPAFTLDYNCLRDALSPSTKAVIAVSLYGQVAPNILQIAYFAKSHNLVLIEDAAQSFGAERTEYKSCSCKFQFNGLDEEADISLLHYLEQNMLATTSFFPTKPLSCCGDGGAIFCGSSKLASKLISLRQHGRVISSSTKQSSFDFMGMNGRLDALQAGILRVKLRYFYSLILPARQAASSYYFKSFEELGSDLFASAGIELPYSGKGAIAHAYAQFAVRVRQDIRDDVVQELNSRKIPTAIHYRKCVHHEKMFQGRSRTVSTLICSEEASKAVICLPMFSFLTKEEVRIVVTEFCAAVRNVQLKQQKMRCLAVIGAGRWGLNHVKTLTRLKLLHTVCDDNPSRLQNVMENHVHANVTHLSNSPSHTDTVCYTENFMECFENDSILGVVIATPASTHYQIAKQALLKGKNVLVEKPMSLNLDEARGHLLLFHPAFCKLLELIEQHSVGQLIRVVSNRLSPGKIRQEEDVVWSFLPHDLSMILAIANGLREKQGLMDSEQPIIRAFCDTSSLQPRIVDSATISLRFEKSQFSADAHLSWLHPFKEHKLIVVGTKGSIVFDDTKEWDEKVILYQNTNELPLPQPVLRNDDSHVSNLGGRLPPTSSFNLDTGHSTSQAIEIADISAALDNELLYFKECIATSTSPKKANAEEAVHVIGILEECRKLMYASDISDDLTKEN